MADLARPNVLIVMSDDQGPWAMGCAGTPELSTPALDRLAAEGTRHAVVDALSEYGIRHIDMPVTPERVWRAIQGARG